MIVDHTNPLAIKNIKRKVPRIAVPLANMVDYWGAQCSEFEPDCPCCKAWGLFNLTGKVPGDDEIKGSTV
jgi:hypothetical protein